MNLPDNKALIRALHRSDEAAFQDLYDRYSVVLFKNIFKLLPHQQEAEDLLQGVFLQLWESRFKLQDEQSVAGWLFTTSFYLTMSRVRRLARERLQAFEEVLSEIPDTDDTMATAELYQQKIKLLDKAIGLLPSRKKQAFELCKLEGKSYREAAVQLGVSEETVKDYVKSAMGILKRQALHADLSLYMLVILWMA